MEATVSSSLQQSIIFLMTVNDFDKHHSGNKYIHDVEQIILMKSGKALIYAYFQ